MTFNKSSCLGDLANILNVNSLTWVINDFALVPGWVHCNRTWELYKHLPALSLINVFDNPYRQINHSTSVPYVSNLGYVATNKMEFRKRKEDTAFNQAFFFQQKVSLDLLTKFRSIHIKLKMIKALVTSYNSMWILPWPQCNNWYNALAIWMIAIGPQRTRGVFRTLSYI